MALTKVTGQVINTSTDVTVGVLTVTNNLSVGGTLTYEDVTNVDSVGLITARNGIVVGSGITLSPDGDGFFTGVITATSFVGDISNATGINTANVRTGILDVAGIATFRSNTLVGSGITLSPDGDGFYTGIVTATSVNTNDLNITGITTFKGVEETTSAGSYSGTELTCDTSTGTVFTHDLQSGLVKSIKISNFPAISNSFHTVTVILIQNDAGTAHTTAALGIGTNVTLDPDGVTGFSTVAMVGSGTTITLGQTANDFNIISFGIHYNGGTNTDVSNYKTFVTKNGDFRLG